MNIEAEGSLEERVTTAIETAISNGGLRNASHQAYYEYKISPNEETIQAILEIILEKINSGAELSQIVLMVNFLCNLDPLGIDAIKARGREALRMKIIEKLQETELTHTNHEILWCLWDRVVNSADIVRIFDLKSCGLSFQEDILRTALKETRAAFPKRYTFYPEDHIDF